MIDIISLFTGAGALDLAFEITGSFKTIVAIEKQPEFASTFVKNASQGLLSDAVLLCEDVCRISPTRISREYVDRGRLLGLIGGPPCESFSSMGRRRGIRDRRGMLVFEFLRVLAGLRANFFLLENVPDLTKIEDGAILKKIVSRASQLGFAVNWSILNAADYGAATTRKRLFVVGMRDFATFQFPRNTHTPRNEAPLFSSSLKPWVTVRDALANLPVASDRAPGTPQGHFLVQHTATVRDRFSRIAPGSYDNVRKRSRLSWDKPSPSLVAGNLSGTRFHIHPSEDREITKREAARIQGFHDDFQFAGTWDCVAKQITNSVPIPVGTALAKALSSHLGS